MQPFMVYFWSRIDSSCHSDRKWKNMSRCYSGRCAYLSFWGQRLKEEVILLISDKFVLAEVLWWLQLLTWCMARFNLKQRNSSRHSWCGDQKTMQGQNVFKISLKDWFLSREHFERGRNQSRPSSSYYAHSGINTSKDIGRFSRRRSY